MIKTPLKPKGIGDYFKNILSPPSLPPIQASPPLIPHTIPAIIQKPQDQWTVGDAEKVWDMQHNVPYIDPVDQSKLWQKQEADALKATAPPPPEVPLAQDIKERMDKAASEMGIQNPASVDQVGAMFKTHTIPTADQLNSVNNPFPAPTATSPTPQPSQPPQPNIIQKGVNAVEGLFKPVSAPTSPTPTPTPTLEPSIEKQVSLVPKDKQDNARAILYAMRDNGTLTPNTAAYALATAQHESDFTPKDEMQAGPYDPDWLKNDQASYDGGWQYHGRGYTQLTGKANYDAIGKKIGVDLVHNPDLANDPKVAAKIMAEFLKSSGTNDYANKGDFVNARLGVNPGELTNGSPNPQTIAGYAQNYLNGGISDPSPSLPPITATPTQPTDGLDSYFGNFLQ